ncbi:hypothetical protein MRX96_053112 [Rhipicephalus microplus]
MRKCGSVDVQCEKCQTYIASEAAEEHYIECYTETDGRRVSNDVRAQRAVEKVRRIKQYLQAFQQQSLGEHDTRHDNLVNGVNELEKLASPDRALSVGQDMHGGHHKPRKF